MKIEPIDKSFKVFNADKTKNGEATRFVLLELEINEYIERINIIVMDLNRMNIFLEYNWLAKHNPEVNWNTETI